MLSLLALAIFSGQPTYHKLVSSGGVSYFCDQNGRKYWSLGVCCVNEGSTKESYKTDNPSYASFRLFINDKEWVDDTLAKLHKWTINTIGGWSNTSLLLKHNRTSCLPYTVVLHLGAYDRAPWEDMFRSEFESICNKAAQEQIELIANDPLLIGYFSDNELGWWDDALFLHYLAMPPSAPGKQKLLSLARQYYKSSFLSFSKDWITNCRSFDDLLVKDTKIWIKPGGKGMQFVNHWTYELARRYYSVMYRAIRKYDKNRLILGDRYAQYWELPVLKAAKPYVNVISTNYGAEYLDGSLTRYFLSTIFEVTKKPILISEFYWNAMENRSGNRNSVKAFPIVNTQEDRASGLSTNLKQLASLPYVVGAHWFQYYDEPQNGRADGEDGNMGLIDIHGQPYELMVKALQDIDFNGLHSKPLLTKSCSEVPKAPSAPMSGLLGWPRSSGWISPTQKEVFGDLYVCSEPDTLYVGLHTMDFVYRDLYEGKDVPNSERPKLIVRFGKASPITIYFGAEKQAVLEGSSEIRLAEWPGVKHQCILAVPWKAIGGKPERRLSIKTELFQHSRAAKMSWKANLKVR